MQLMRNYRTLRIWTLAAAALVFLDKRVAAADPPIPGMVHFPAPISAAVQDPETFQVFTITPSLKEIHRYDVSDLKAAQGRPAATVRMNGEPRQLIIKPLGDRRFVFVHCTMPNELVQLDAVSLQLEKSIPLQCGTVGDLFASESGDDPFVWLIYDNRSPSSKSAIRRWELGNLLCSGNQPVLTPVLSCAAAAISPDGALLLTADWNGVRPVLRAIQRAGSSLHMNLTDDAPWLDSVRLSRGACFSRDGSALLSDGRVVSTGNPAGNVTVSELPGKAVSLLKSAPISVVHTEIPGARLGLGSGLSFFDMATGEELCRITPSEAAGPKRHWRVFETGDATGLFLMNASSSMYLQEPFVSDQLLSRLKAAKSGSAFSPDVTQKSVAAERSGTGADSAAPHETSKRMIPNHTSPPEIAARYTIELPFVPAGIAVDPDTGRALLWSSLLHGPDPDDIDSVMISLCIVDVNARIITAKGEVLYEKLTSAVIDDSQVFLTVGENDVEALVVLNEHDLSLKSKISLYLPVSRSGPVTQMGFAETSRELLISAPDQILRGPVGDLNWVKYDRKWTSDELKLLTQSNRSPQLLPHGILQNSLLMNWDGTPELWGVLVMHRQSNHTVRQPFFGGLSEPDMSLTSSDRRFVTGDQSQRPIQTHFHGSAATSIFLRCTLIRTHDALASPENRFESRLIVESAHRPPVQVNFETGEILNSTPQRDPLPPEELRMQSFPTPEGAFILNANGRVDEDRFSCVSTTNDQLLLAKGKQLQVYSLSEIGMPLAQDPNLPRFIRRQSVFVADGAGPTVLQHQTTGTGDLKFSLSRPLPGVSVAPDTGNVTIDHQGVAAGCRDTFVAQWNRAKNKQKLPPDMEGQINSMLEQLVSEFKRSNPLNMGDPGGFPVYVPIELVLLQNDQPIDAIGYTVAVIIPRDPLLKSLVEAFR